MKKINNACYAALTILILFISSCVPDDDATPNADVRDKFVGNWNCSETANGTKDDFSIVISKSNSNTSTVLITNFNNLNSTYIAKATVSNSSLSIASQQVTGNSGVYTVQGSGSISNETINLSYFVKDGVGPDVNATAVCTPK